MQIIGGSGRLRVEVRETEREIRYSVWDKDKLRTEYSVQKRPGWKKVWDEALVAITATIKEIEEGTGLQSRAFQQTSSASVSYNTLWG